MSRAAPPVNGFAYAVVGGPRRVGSELRWSVQLADGRPALLAIVAPELAHDESVRRRYFADVSRIHRAALPGIATTLATWPGRAASSNQPSDFGERDDYESVPGRLVEAPVGETLDQWLVRRAPAPLDEGGILLEQICRVVGGVHGRGHVLRDLSPRQIVLGDPIQLTVAFLARVDLLSTRTAASLLLESSPYAAPEQLMHTIVDRRADVYTLGVIAYQLFTGALPFPDHTGFLRTSPQHPADPCLLRSDLPPAWGELILRCLEYDPTQRPDGVDAIVDALHGLGSLRSTEQIGCQACGASMRVGQRICLACGQQAVQFFRAGDGEGGWGVQLRKLDEGAETLARLRRTLARLTEEPLPALNFILGDARMYSSRERAEGITLPIWLFSHLTRETAEQVAELLREQGFRVQARVHDVRRQLHREMRYVALAVVAASMAAAGIGFLASGVAAALAIGGIAGAAGLVIALNARRLRRRSLSAFDPLLALRRAPAALPASDPLVGRLAALLGASAAADLREQIGALALCVQRLVDHRARHQGEAADIDRVTEPVADLVALIEEQAQQVQRIDDELSSLDEGTMVRAFAASEARGEPPAARESLLTGLDRLRTLEDARARAFQSLLEAGRLLRRATEHGLSRQDETAAHERDVAAAFAVLQSSEIHRE